MNKFNDLPRKADSSETHEIKQRAMIMTRYIYVYIYIYIYTERERERERGEIKRDIGGEEK